MTTSPVPRKRQNVTDLVPESVLDGEIFLVLGKERATTRSGKPYLNLVLGDRTGQVEAKVWDDADRWAARFGRGDVVQVHGVGNPYQGRMQLKVSSIERISEDVIEMAALIPSSRYDIDEMERDVRAMVDDMADPWIRSACRAFIDDQGLWSKFRIAPAAKTLHHAWRGGLLEHTLAVMRVCRTLAGIYPTVNRDLVLAGALLHDLGKVVELGTGPVVAYSDPGRLVGHLAICITWIANKAACIKGFPEDLTWHLQHLVASHHGTLEQGAVQLPLTLEAEMLSLADLLDSRMAGYQRVMEESPEEKGSSWTRFQRVYDRALYRGSLDWRDHSGDGRASGTPGASGTQGVPGASPETAPGQARSGSLFDDL